MNSERYRDATRVDERHEIQADDGWLRVIEATTFSTGGLRVREFRLADGRKFGLRLPAEVMSRLAKKEEEG